MRETVGRRIYCDYAATTPLHPLARAAMLEWADHLGNPSSLHAEGRKAKDALDVAREKISATLRCLFAEVVFTSGGTESVNLAILGAALASLGSTRNRILFGASEHHCVLNLTPVLEKIGYQVDLIPTDGRARIDLEALGGLIGQDVLLVSVMHANNEVGTLQPVPEVASLCRMHGALFHCDAAQTFCMPKPGGTWGVDDLGADLISLSAHKVYGPKGAGALYVRAGTKLSPVVTGGGQERELRGGTENVAGILGFASAVEDVSRDSAGWERKRAARDAFLARLGAELPNELLLTGGDGPDVLAGHAHVRIPGVSAESMLILLDGMGVSASSGAACSSGSLEASHVLLACGLSEAEAREGLRFTFGLDSTVEDAVEAAARVAAAADRLKPR